MNELLDLWEGHLHGADLANVSSRLIHQSHQRSGDRDSFVDGCELDVESIPDFFENSRISPGRLHTVVVKVGHCDE